MKNFKNKKHLKTAGIILLSLFVIFSFKNSVYGEHLRNDVAVIFPHGEINAQLANTNPSRELGLSYRKTIFDKEGMFFVFDQPGNYSFWMKDMNFPIDIFWIQDGRVVGMAKGLPPPQGDIIPDAFSPEPVSLVLETNAGFADKYGIFLGSPFALVP